MSNVLEGLDEIVEQPPLPEAKVNIDPPSDQPRAEDGKFSSTDGKKQEKTEAKEPELKPEPKAEPKHEPKTIPLAAYLEDKNKWQQKFEAMEKELATLKNPPKAPEPAPAFEQDPKGFVQHTVDSKVQSALDQLEGIKKQVETGQKTAQQAATEAQELRFQLAIQSAEAEFHAKTPDYQSALDHLRQARFSELALMHPDTPQEQVIAFMQREEQEFARMHIAAGRNPSQIAYAIAKARGYAPKSAAPAIPEVPGPKSLPPDQTLGSGSGAPASGETFIDDEDALDLALKQVFGRRKAS